VHASKITAEPAGEMTLIAFFQRMGTELQPNSRLVLNHLMRALVDRGWLPSVDALVSGLAERGESPEDATEAVADLVYRRLVETDPAGRRITSLLGAISLERTGHRGHLSNSVDIFTRGGVDLLSLNALLVHDVDATTGCGHCEAPVSLRMEGEAIVALSPHGAAGFQASWDGTSELAEVSSASPLFCSDACLNLWAEAHPEVDGLALPADLLLHIGCMMAAQSGNARFQLFGIET